MQRTEYLALAIVACLACSAPDEMATSSTSEIRIVDPEELRAPAGSDETTLSRDLATRAEGSNRVEFRHTVLLSPELEGKDVTYDSQDEFVYVLKGQADITTGGQTRRIGPGSFLFVPQGVPYDFKMIEAPLEVIVAFSPPGE